MNEESKEVLDYPKLDDLFNRLINGHHNLTVNRRHVVKEILEVVGRAILCIDRISDDNLNTNHDIENIIDKCKESVRKLAYLIGYGDSQIKVFLLEELLPNLKSNSSLSFILDCISVCYCKESLINNPHNNINNSRKFCALPVYNPSD